MYVVDPINFVWNTISAEDSKAWLRLDGLMSKVEFKVAKSGVDGLKNINDFVFNSITKRNLWKDIPADTRFPGYFSSLADHALATAAIAVPLAVEIFNKGYDFGKDYENDLLKNSLRNIRGVVEIVRFLSLLHDVGKHPPNGHCERAREYINNILKRFGLEEFYELAESAARHHYGISTKDENRPRTMLEWVIAFSDKISSTQERGISGEIAKLREPYNWLLERDTENKVKIEKFLKFLGKVDQYIDDPEIYTLVPINTQQIQKLDERIFNSSQILGEVRLGVFCLEVAGIQKFVTASDYRKYLSGASALIDEALNDVRLEIEKMLCPECVIYSKGGSLLAIIPPSFLYKLKEKASKIFEEKTKTARLKLPENIEFELWELKYGPQSFWRDDVGSDVKLRLVERRNFGSVVSSVISSLKTTEKTGETEIIGVGEICPLCNEYKKSEYKHMVDDEETYICERCNFVVETHRKLKEKEGVIQIKIKESKVAVDIPLGSQDISTSYSRIIWRIRETLEKRLKNNPIVAEYHSKGVCRINFIPIKTWDYLGRQHIAKDYAKDDEVYDVAFIKGDGDNFGKIKGSMSSIALYRRTSEMFEDVIEGSIADALTEVILKQLEIRVEKDVRDNLILELPFDVVFIGGDDFLIVIDAAFVFIFLMTFRKSLQAKLGNKKEKFEKEKHEPLSIVPLGVSMGIAIVKNKMPFKSILDVTNHLLYKAKQKSKEDARKFGAEIFIFVRKFDAIPTKEDINDSGRFTQFPMSGEEFLAFTKKLRFFVERKVSPNWIKGAFDAAKGPVDAYVDLLYKIARSSGEEREWLRKIADMHKDGLKNVGDFVFKHLDIAESLEIVGGKLTLEGFSDEDRKKIMLKLLGG